MQPVQVAGGGAAACDARVAVAAASCCSAFSPQAAVGSLLWLVLSLSTPAAQVMLVAVLAQHLPLVPGSHASLEVGLCGRGSRRAKG